MNESHRPGRPSFHLTSEQVAFFRRTGMNWTKISQTLNISRKTLFRHRKKFVHFEVPISNLPDDELDRIIIEIIRETPNAGEVYVMGALRARYLKIPRAKLRERLNLIDPIGRASRRRTALKRRVYNVKGPNYLWHIDSNHKLISFRFVFHGCIDGFSRCIIHLNCTTDNKAATVLRFFQGGVSNFGLPSRVRADRGMENIHVAQYVLEKRGVDRGSFITGRSVHNQRIERLWAEVNRVVSQHFKQLFMDMENEGILEERNEVDLFALAVVFLPRIRQSLHTFIQQWNFHGLSTEGGASPIQLWQVGMLQCNDFDSDDPAYYEDPEWYGVEEFRDDPLLQTENDVIVPEYEIALTNAEEQGIRNLVPDPLQDDGNHGILHYLNIRNYLNNIIFSV